MGDWILLGAVAAVIAAAVIVLRKRAGRKGCCGSGSDYRPRRKKLKTVVKTRTFVIAGMHCEHCAGRIMETINDIPQTAATVDWKKGTAVVDFSGEIPEETLCRRIERLGYRVTEIR